MPALHVEVLEGMEVKLGSFVSYLRQRRRKLREDRDIARNRGDSAAVRKLESNLVKFREREEALESIPGWEWGPLRPGPASKAARNKEIQRLYGDGARVKVLADTYELSRQRIHQIVGPEAFASA